MDRLLTGFLKGPRSFEFVCQRYPEEDILNWMDLRGVKGFYRYQREIIIKYDLVALYRTVNAAYWDRDIRIILRFRATKIAAYICSSNQIYAFKKLIRLVPTSILKRMKGATWLQNWTSLHRVVHYHPLLSDEIRKDVGDEKFREILLKVTRRYGNWYVYLRYPEFINNDVYQFVSDWDHEKAVGSGIFGDWMDLRPNNYIASKFPANVLFLGHKPLYHIFQEETNINYHNDIIKVSLARIESLESTISGLEGDDKKAAIIELGLIKPRKDWLRRNCYSWSEDTPKGTLVNHWLRSRSYTFKC